MTKEKVSVTQKLFDFDASFGADFLCGCDEAGRGPLAGPVVCAAVIMPKNTFLEGVNDSKKVNERRREQLFDSIKASAVCYRIAAIDHKIIDEINILEATKRGMEQAILSLDAAADKILVDAVKGLNLSREYAALIKGDAISYAIACASILAKVTRDRIMTDYAKTYPEYGFEKHKGYGTAAHIAALKRYGKTPIHRVSFIKNFCV